ncbi:MAG: squalene synthase HpnC [Ignavibacteriales bacterium]
MKECISGNFASPFWQALQNTIIKFSIDPKLLYDLIDAFAQDLIKTRYKNFGELIAYCEKSANPVGRIILALNGINDTEAAIFSDKICTALQLTNFYQDTSIDLQKDRVYYPIDELEQFNVSISDLKEGVMNENIKNLIKHQIQRTEILFGEGKKLIKFLPFKLRIQINATIEGGLKILQKIEQIDFNVLKFRVKLSKFDTLLILLKALRNYAGN